MSRAFVKDADAIDELPDRPISAHHNEVTREGLRRIESALTAAQEAFAAAQLVGDREGLASAGRNLRYWTARRSTAVVAPEPEDNSVVRFGHAVTILRSDGRKQTFRIVGEDEADPARGADDDNSGCHFRDHGSVGTERFAGASSLVGRNRTYRGQQGRLARKRLCRLR